MTYEGSTYPKVRIYCLMALE